MVGIFPNRDALIRLVGAVLAEQHDEWAEGRRYLGLDVLTRSRLTIINTDPTKINNTTEGGPDTSGTHRIECHHRGSQATPTYTTPADLARSGVRIPSAPPTGFVGALQLVAHSADSQ